MRDPVLMQCLSVPCGSGCEKSVAARSIGAARSAARARRARRRHSSSPATRTGNAPWKPHPPTRRAQTSVMVTLTNASRWCIRFSDRSSHHLLRLWLHLRQPGGSLHAGRLEGVCGIRRLPGWADLRGGWRVVRGVRVRHRQRRRHGCHAPARCGPKRLGNSGRGRPRCECARRRRCRDWRCGRRLHRDVMRDAARLLQPNGPLLQPGLLGLLHVTTSVSRGDRGCRKGNPRRDAESCREPNVGAKKPLNDAVPELREALVNGDIGNVTVLASSPRGRSVASRNCRNCKVSGPRQT